MEEVLLASVRAQHGPTAIKLAHEPRVRQWLSAAELQELQIAENRYRQHFMEELSFRPVEEPMSSVPESVHQSTKVDFAQGSKPPALAGFEDWSFLGKGGMAEVWRGRDRKTGRVEAVKIAFAIDPETIRRFQLEARSMATIDHRNVRRVYGADVAPTAGRISAWSFWPVPL
jgi:serine/threonine protein kinase